MKPSGSFNQLLAISTVLGKAMWQDDDLVCPIVVDRGHRPGLSDGSGLHLCYRHSGAAIDRQRILNVHAASLIAAHRCAASRN